MPFFYVFFFNLDLGQLSSHIYTSSRENGPGTLAYRSEGIKARRAHPCSVMIENVNILYIAGVIMLLKNQNVFSFQGNN